MNRSGNLAANPGEMGADGERGLGATILGGVAGGYAGHRMGNGGVLKTGLSAIAGAVAANLVEHEGKLWQHMHADQQPQPQMMAPRGYLPEG